MYKSRFTCRLESERGQSLTEMALVMPILVLILMGIFDLSRAVYYYNAINQGAREMARQSITACGNGQTAVNCSSQDSATKTTVVNQLVGVPITTSDITISPTSRKYGDTIIVSISINYVPITPLIAQYLGAGGQITLSARSQMLVQ